MNENETYGEMKAREFKRNVKIAIGVVIFLFAFAFALGSFGTVKAGQEGVRLRFSKVVGTVDPGLYFKVPFIETVKKINVQTQKEQVKAQAASSDLQNVTATIAVNYNVQADKAGELYERIGKNYRERVIDPAIQESVKEATAKFSAEELITLREEARGLMLNSLKIKLSESFINVTDLSIVNFSFSQTFDHAIEAKVTAEQDALAAENKLQQVKFEADQRVAQAEAEAEAIRIQATAINSQGGEDYVNLKAIEKWNGILPAQFVPGSAMPFINLN